MVEQDAVEYDLIASRYDEAVDNIGFRAMEMHSMGVVLEPLLSQPDVKVLELACGTGFFTSHLMAWGAASVTAVDISSMMIEQAVSKLAGQVLSGQVRFLVADGTKPQSFAPDNSAEYFDVVLGAWFLNYAQTKAELTAMFDTISLNLRPGGTFVGSVPHPTNHLAERALLYNSPPLNQIWPRNCYTHELESKDGWALRVYIDRCGIGFQTWHLKKSVYEAAARQGGLKGKLEWKSEIFLGDHWASRLGLMDEDWTVRKDNPHLGIIVVSKN
ncbi:hypothetical protein CDD81_316 [Ophiocordyceps australis]|uniref:Methyltransferase domain-containing protein n=1 Tax=Ophiocordyceps australis TaxID=1399860 RepID=A0A2C5XW82_9HYPO|nr:hypothetical protein CDD81_316 [Ophiocordyceps australis]